MLRQQSNHSLSFMRDLSRKSLYVVKVEVEGMSSEEAGHVWGQVESFFPGVCARASSCKRDSSWLELVRKLELIRRKAEVDGA